MSAHIHVYGPAGRLFGGGLRMDAHHGPGAPPGCLPPPVRAALGSYAQNGSVAVAEPIGCVGDAMSRAPATVRHDAPAADALRLLRHPRASGVAVVNDAGRLVGMVLRPGQEPPLFKVRARLRRPLGWLHGPRAAEVMLTPVPAVGKATTLRQVRRVLADLGLHGLPVTDAEGGVVGHIARGDVDRAASTAMRLLDCWA